MKSARAPLQTESEIMDAALGLLSRREYSEAELIRKLLEKTEQKQLVEIVLARVQTLGYQNDQRFTETYIRYSVSQGKGASWIKMKLRQKGVLSDLIDICLVNADLRWTEIAQAQLQRKFKSQQIDVKEKAKWYRFLASRGFSPDVISEVIDRHIKQL